MSRSCTVWSSLAVARYRDRHHVSGAKSDAGDAKLLADLVRTDRHNHRPIAGASPAAEAIKVLARGHQNLIWARTRHTNALRSALREYYPAALKAFDDLHDRDALAVLGRAPTPANGARLPIPAISDLETTLADRFEQHPDAEIILSQPGLGPMLGARVLAEFGDDPERYTTAKCRKNYAGTSPLTVASGKKRAVLAQDSRSYGQVPSTMLSLVEVGPLGDPSTDKITCSMPRIVTWADRVTLRVYGDDVTFRGANRDTEAVVGILIGYARCSTDEQDLTAQRNILLGLGVAEDRIYLDHGLTGTTRGRPGLREALAAVRAGDTLVVPKLDRLARSVPDAREIGDSLVARDVKLSLGGQVYDPTDPMGKMFFNILATFAEFEVDLLRMRTREGMAIARAKGKLRGKQPKLSARQQAHLVELHEAGKHTVVELAELFNVSRPTVYRVLERHQARQSAGGSAEIPDLAKGLPPDTRPLPDVSKYDELLPSRKAAVR